MTDWLTAFDTRVTALNERANQLCKQLPAAGEPRVGYLRAQEALAREWAALYQQIREAWTSRSDRSESWSPVVSHLCLDAIRMQFDRAELYEDLAHAAEAHEAAQTRAPEVSP